MSAVAQSDNGNRGAVWGDNEIKTLIAVWGEFFKVMCKKNWMVE